MVAQSVVVDVRVAVSEKADVVRYQFLVHALHVGHAFKVGQLVADDFYIHRQTARYCGVCGERKDRMDAPRGVVGD